MEESKLNKYVKINQRFKSERQPYNNWENYLKLNLLNEFFKEEQYYYHTDTNVNKFLCIKICTI